LLTAPTQVLEHPAGHKDLALTGKKPSFELDLSSGVALSHQYRPLGRDHLVNGLDTPGLTLAHLPIISLVYEEERQDALGDQVAAMDPREALGHDRADAKV
jgi:hypothetical protein